MQNLKEEARKANFPVSEGPEVSISDKKHIYDYLFFTGRNPQTVIENLAFKTFQVAPLLNTDTPVEDTPVEDTPVGDTPVEDTSVEDSTAY